MRTDCTVTEANIHRPTDASLLSDGVRVLTRLMARAKDDLGDIGIVFTNHPRRARRRALGILNAKKRKQTDIIVKDRRETYFGHKLAISGGGSGQLTDLVIKRGNPADSTLAQEMIERQQDIYGRVPRQVAFDGGFASKDNLRAIKKMGVKDVAFHRRCGLKITEMAKSTWVYKRLRNFRAGIEGMISFLKRGFGLGRCNWRGFESFKAYAWASVITANLLLVARHMIT